MWTINLFQSQQSFEGHLCQSSSFPTFQPTHTTRNSKLRLQLFYRVPYILLVEESRPGFSQASLTMLRFIVNSQDSAWALPQFYSLHQSVGQDVAHLSLKKECPQLNKGLPSWNSALLQAFQLSFIPSGDSSTSISSLTPAVQQKVKR